MDTREHYNDIINALLQDVRTNKQKAENDLVNFLIELLEVHPQKPTSKTDEYLSVNFLFWNFNDAAKPTEDSPLLDQYPLNSVLLTATSRPQLIQTILFQMLNYLHPQDPPDYTQAELLSNLREYKRSRTLPTIADHQFEYTQGREGADSVLKVKLETGKLHILSY